MPLHEDPAYRRPKGVGGQESWQQSITRETGMLRRRPLLRAAATTAVVAGTATAVSGRVARRQQSGAQEAAAEQAIVPEVVTPPPPPATGLSADGIERLKELAALHEQGVLTDDEFATQKAQILG